MIQITWWQFGAVIVAAAWVGWKASFYFFAFKITQAIVETFECKGAEGLTALARQIQEPYARLRLSLRRVRR